MGDLHSQINGMLSDPDKSFQDLFNLLSKTTATTSTPSTSTVPPTARADKINITGKAQLSKETAPSSILTTSTDRITRSMKGNSCGNAELSTATGPASIISTDSIRTLKRSTSEYSEAEPLPKLYRCLSFVFADSKTDKSTVDVVMTNFASIVQLLERSGFDVTVEYDPQSEVVIRFTQKPNVSCDMRTAILLVESKVKSLKEEHEKKRCEHNEFFNDKFNELKESTISTLKSDIGSMVTQEVDRVQKSITDQLTELSNQQLSFQAEMKTQMENLSRSLSEKPSGTSSVDQDAVTNDEEPESVDKQQQQAIDEHTTTTTTCEEIPTESNTSSSVQESDLQETNNFNMSGVSEQLNVLMQHPTTSFQDVLTLLFSSPSPSSETSQEDTNNKRKRTHSESSESVEPLLKKHCQCLSKEFVTEKFNELEKRMAEHFTVLTHQQLQCQNEMKTKMESLSKALMEKLTSLDKTSNSSCESTYGQKTDLHSVVAESVDQQQKQLRAQTTTTTTVKKSEETVEQAYYYFYGFFYLVPLNSEFLKALKILRKCHNLTACRENSREIYDHYDRCGQFPVIKLFIRDYLYFKFGFIFRRAGVCARKTHLLAFKDSDDTIPILFHEVTTQ